MIDKNFADSKGICIYYNEFNYILKYFLILRIIYQIWGNYIFTKNNEKFYFLGDVKFLL